MFNYVTQRHITHVLLIDGETLAELRDLVQNAMGLYKEFCRIARLPSYDSYTLLLVFPEARRDLYGPSSEIESDVNALGAKCKVEIVKDSDMFRIKGKAGLLTASMSLMAGAILVNDAPISVGAAALLARANRDDGIEPIGQGLNAALIAGGARSIGPAVFGVPTDHRLGDILLALGAPDSRKKWWEIWR